MNGEVEDMERRMVGMMLDGAMNDHRHAVAMSVCIVLPGLLLIGASLFHFGETVRVNVIMGAFGTAWGLYGIAWTAFNLRKSRRNIAALHFRMNNPGRAAR